jgi:hypothetical protein
MEGVFQGEEAKCKFDTRYNQYNRYILLIFTIKNRGNILLSALETDILPVTTPLNVWIPSQPDSPAGRFYL